MKNLLYMFIGLGLLLLIPGNINLAQASTNTAALSKQELSKRVADARLKAEKTIQKVNKKIKNLSERAEVLTVAAQNKRKLENYVKDHEKKKGVTGKIQEKLYVEKKKKLEQAKKQVVNDAKKLIARYKVKEAESISALGALIAETAKTFKKGSQEVLNGFDKLKSETLSEKQLKKKFSDLSQELQATTHFAIHPLEILNTVVDNFEITNKDAAKFIKENNIK